MADNLYLMASHGCPHGLILEQKNSMGIIKSYGAKLEITKLGYMKLRPQQCKEPWRSTSGLKNSVSWEKHSVLVAYYDSPEKIKTRMMEKQKNGEKVGRDRDLYARNYFHACENLLCLMMDRNKHGNLAIHSLQKSGPELPELLTQVSASIAGSGLAVLFSFVCNVACGRVFSASKLLMNTGVGFGLVWLSWAVNKLRDTIVPITKNSRKMDLKEEVKRVERRVNEISFRAATLMAVAVVEACLSMK